MKIPADIKKLLLIYKTMRTDPTVLLQQAVITDYRMGVFLLLRKQWKERFEIIAGESDFNPTTRTTPEAWEHFQKVPNHYFLRRRFLWQGKSLRRMLAADVLILNANMRILSNWVVLFLRKMLKRKTILWGHAHGKVKTAAKIRGTLLRLADGFITYTETQAAELKEFYPWLRLWTAPNSCVFADNCIPAQTSPEQIDSILYVGRLVTAKKVQLLLDGYSRAIRSGQLPQGVRLVFVGDGPERDKLEKATTAAGFAGQVFFAGHVSDIQQLREYYSRAVCATSPGYVGLSATQSFSFGVPMLVAKDEFHSPEIEACRDGVNSLFFNSNDAADLADKLGLFFKNKAQWFENRYTISNWTKANYSFEAMRTSFVDAVTTVLRGKNQMQG